MLLTLSGSVSSQDLGYLLHKSPARLHSIELSFGKVHVFYPQSETGRGVVSLLLDIDPVELARGRDGASLRQYVNDRPYATTSFMSVALARALGTAMSGRSKERQELADTATEWTAELAAVPCRGGEAVVKRLFEPLGYTVRTSRHPLDERFPEWGDGAYHTVWLSASMRLSQLLTHLYVLIPVLDADKHYWVGEAEVEKLLRKGEGWLPKHPDRELIVERYLLRRRTLTRAALERLVEDDVLPEENDGGTHETVAEEPLRLWQQRIDVVLGALRDAGAKSVVDLGCGEGKLLRELIKDRNLERIVGMDVSIRALERASDRLRLDQLAPARREQIQLIHGSLVYRDRRLEGFDAATICEVIEHLDPPRLASLERSVFEHARPSCIILTTPNAEYNAKFESMRPGEFRHGDHRFEWTREEFQTWACDVAKRHSYTVTFAPIGPEDAEYGAPTQMGVFSR